MLQDSHEFRLTETIITVAATVGFGALAALLKVWLENKRLLKKDYRESMCERIEQLEEQLTELNAQRAKDREEIGGLRAEVGFLKGEHAQNHSSGEPG